jgi:hydrogenase nickel incorporation protein HypA/HybF
MHELSIALNIVEIASETLNKNGGGKISALFLKLGKLSGVEKDALLFSWDLACADTALEGSRLIIEEIPVAVHCKFCHADQTLNSINKFSCPVCQNLAPEIVRGRELELTALEII